MRSRAALVVVLFLALPLSGCLDASGAVDGAPALAFTAPVRLPALAGAWEPSLVVHPDGALFVTAFERDVVRGAVAPVFRSTDGGASWERLGVPTGTNAGDPHLAVGPDGSLWSTALWTGCNSVAVSRDAGDAWRTHPAVCGLPGGDRPSVAPLGDGRAVLVWLSFATRTHEVMVTADDGVTWTRAGSVQDPVPPPQVTGSWPGWGVASANPVTGSVLLPFTLAVTRADGGFDGVPVVAVSRDAGASWAQAPLDADAAPLTGVHPVAVAFDAAGVAHATWTRRDADGTSVLVATSRDDARSWSTPRVVDASSTAKAFPQVAAGAEGALAVAWLEADAPGAPEDAPADARWRVRVAWARDAEAPAATWARAWVHADPALKGALCTRGATNCGEHATSLGEYFGLARLADGHVGVAWPRENADGARDVLFARSLTAFSGAS